MLGRCRRKSMEVSAHDGDFKTVVAIIEEGGDVNAKMQVGGGGTALHQACFGDNPDIADYLIKANADLDAKMDDGRTPLLCCCNGDGSIAVSKLLLEAGCDKSAATKNNLTALDLAVRASGQDELETLLREWDVPANSKLTNWRQAKKAVKKIAIVQAMGGLKVGTNKEVVSAVSDAPKSPLSPSQRYKKEQEELKEGDLTL